MTTHARLAAQLYSLRDAFQRDFDGTLAAVAAIGYAGVEVASLHGKTPVEVAQRCAELGLIITSNHDQLPLDEQQGPVIERALALGSPRLVCPYLPPAQFASRDAIARVAEQLNAAAAAARAHGLRFGYHNHDHEYALVEGRPAMDWLVEQLDEDVFIELDVYWAAVAGQHPADAVRALGPRAELLHIKDGPADSREAPMTAVGQGRIDVAAVLSADAGTAVWLIVELDRCATDMLTALRDSYTYLVSRV
jgi:sugar phosphate isomerase/epimerase